MTIEADRLGCQAAHARLLETVATVTDADVARPSRLPDWTLGHVLTHLARNADSHVRMLEAAARGEVAGQYPGGNERRAADIAAGAVRTAAALADDVQRTIDRLEATWRATPAEAWATGVGRVASGAEWPLAELPFYRWREVEIHHADLGLGFGWADWSDAYVDADLPRNLARLPERLAPGADLGFVDTLAAAVPKRRLLAWLVGRLDGEPIGEPIGGHTEFPAIGPWRY